MHSILFKPTKSGKKMGLAVLVPTTEYAVYAATQNSLNTSDSQAYATVLHSISVLCVSVASQYVLMETFIFVQVNEKSEN